MRHRPDILINAPLHEWWPAWLLRPRRSDHARRFARAARVLRRKQDGRFLAVLDADGLHPLLPPHREDGLEAALAALRQGPVAGHLPLDDVHALHARLGLAPDYAETSGLPEQAEPRSLQLAGRDRYGRPLWLLAPTARAWRAMRAAALRDGVALDAISGYRSHAYQQGIFERKFARGLSLADVLRVNAAPGHSEHHSGRALDIGTPGEPPAEESFEHTAAFAWLRGNAGRFGFQLSYPRDNPHGIVYEPWHWCWHPASRLSPASA
jgi:D-alanyl-D-alanine carboxypeptidase